MNKFRYIDHEAELDIEIKKMFRLYRGTKEDSVRKSLIIELDLLLTLLSAMRALEQHPFFNAIKPMAVS